MEHTYIHTHIYNTCTYIYSKTTGLTNKITIELYDIYLEVIQYIKYTHIQIQIHTHTHTYTNSCINVNNNYQQSTKIMYNEKCIN